MAFTVCRILHADLELRAPFFDLKAALTLIAPVYILVVLPPLFLPIPYVLQECRLQVVIGCEWSPAVAHQVAMQGGLLAILNDTPFLWRKLRGAAVNGFLRDLDHS